MIPQGRQAVQIGSHSAPAGAASAPSGRRPRVAHYDSNAGIASESDHTSRALTAGECHNQIGLSLNEHPLIPDRAGFSAETFPIGHIDVKRDTAILGWPTQWPACRPRGHRQRSQCGMAGRHGDDRASHKLRRGRRNPCRRTRELSVYLALWSPGIPSLSASALAIEEHPMTFEEIEARAIELFSKLRPIKEWPYIDEGDRNY